MNKLELSAEYYFRIPVETRTRLMARVSRLLSNYCAWDDPLSTSAEGQWGSGSAGNGSNSPGVFGNMDRLTEVLSGHIYHAGQGEVECEATAGGNRASTSYFQQPEPSNRRWK